MSETKALTGVSISDASEGRVKAVFSTLNVIDADGDVTVPGAFQNGQQVKISAFGHASWGAALPVGKGTITSTGSEAVLDGQFFLNTQAGRDTFETIKQIGDLQEWSYGYDVLDSELGQFNGQDVQFLKSLKVVEVSPVLVGAGVGTRTLSAKAVKRAIPPHSTKTSDAAWDGPAAKANLPNDDGEQAYKAAFAWYDQAAADPNGDGLPDAKNAWKFIHHEVTADGEVGAANIPACVIGIGILNGGRGGANIPDADRKGVWEHLARHISDAGSTPPELKSAETPALSDHTTSILGDVAGLVARLQSFGTNGAKDGRVISAANRQRLQALMASLADTRAELDLLLQETDPNKGRADVLREVARFQHLLASQGDRR